MTDDAQRSAERIVRAMMAADRFSRSLGVEIIEIAPDRSVVSLTVRDDMVNGLGVAHGGVVYSLADTALAFASNTHGTVTVSIENGISYPAAVRIGDTLTATAEQERATRRLAFFRVTVRNQTDEAVALFRGTVYRTSTPHA